MPDITTVWNTSQSAGDWQMSGPSLLSGNDLPTAILISLLTDRLAETDDPITDGTNDPRGWWGDLGADYPIGSRLWLLERAKQTNDTLQLAQNYATEALQWLIDDGVVASFDILTEWTRPRMLGMRITAYRQDGSVIVATQYNFAWNGLN